MLWGLIGCDGPDSLAAAAVVFCVLDLGQWTDEGVVDLSSTDPELMQANEVDCTCIQSIEFI